MTKIAQELDERLSALDRETAAHVETLVRDILALTRVSKVRKDAMGYPEGYFEATTASFADEPLDRPEDSPPTTRTRW